MRGCAVFFLIAGAALFGLGMLATTGSRDASPLASIYVPLQMSINMVGFFGCSGLAAVIWFLPDGQTMKPQP